MSSSITSQMKTLIDMQNKIFFKGYSFVALTVLFTVCFFHSRTALAQCTIGEPILPYSSVAYGQGSVTLDSDAGIGGNTIRWYANLSDVVYLAQGPTYTTPVLTATTNYYAASYSTVTGCESTRVLV